MQVTEAGRLQLQEHPPAYWRSVQTCVAAKAAGAV